MKFRSDNRKANELRKLTLTPQYLKAPAGSCLIQMGNTRVVCSVMVENSVPPFLKNKGQGWLTAEYSMLPASSRDRIARERNKVGGRTHEIQRLIGRSLRQCVDLYKLGEKSLVIDCDVIDADGGTRTAAITGSYVALKLALQKLNLIHVLTHQVAAVSVGVVDDECRLDLHYDDDQAAQVDMNVVMIETGQFIEVQGTGEKRPFSKDQLNELLGLAEKGIRELFTAQESAWTS